MIEVEGLTQRYGAYTAVRELSFRLEAGEVVGFLGPNGAGKTTTLKVLAGYQTPSAGTVRVGGHDVSREPLQVRRRLGYLPEHCPLYLEMRAGDFLEFVARVRGVGARAARQAAIARAAARCRLEDVLDRPLVELSKGYRQRVGLAQAILHDPPVLVLDEPTHGLDPNQVLEVRQLVRELGQERTVLFSSHVLAEVEATCRRVLVLHQGRLVADAPLDELRRRATGGAVRLRLARPDPGAGPALTAVEGVAKVEALEPAGCWRVVPAPGCEDLSARLFRWAAASEERALIELTPATPTLEDVFHALTGGQGA